jgi:AcrR family transcriptional regulator
VLAAARTLVRERGFNATTTKQIAEACELSEATLFFYFKSKDEIFTSLLLEGIDFMAKGLDAIAEQAAPPAQKLTRLWRFFSEVRREHPEHFQVFATLGHPHSTANVSDEVRADLARRSGDNLRRFASLLETCGVREPRLAADLVWASFMGLMVLRDSRVNLGAKARPNDAELRASFEMLLHGITSRRG